MNWHMWPVIGTALAAIALYVLERRRVVRGKRERALQTFRWRADDRDRAVQFGQDMFAKTGHPYFDPANYDSHWEYAEAVREHLDLPWLCDIEVGTATAMRDGLRHRVARLRVEDYVTPTLLCNPDLVQSRIDAGDLPVTCVRCLAKEQDEDGA